ncbi:hypothetical protein LTS18_003957 [Coniosporium uncinatum]|uniref:Uncharacterized protein n=1 Tax=Coniosporium uncinatum TaxID=93489 RepID=A0ACC3D671_9PEZI|nr:hypothetical protein LTS18_003957 [Coniosporium uncinatum]
MKQELPLLSTDNELDLKNFRHMMSPDFDNANLPLEPVDEENNEGLTWPQQFHHLPNQFDAKSKSEKLEITKDALIYLRATLRHDLVEPLTPLLRPLSPPPTPFVPSPNTARLELLSDGTDSTLAEAQAIEHQLISRDAVGNHDVGSEGIIVDSDGLGQLYSPLQRLGNADSQTSNKRRLRDLRVEGPLTPSLVQSSPKRTKLVSFPEMLHEYIPDPLSRYMGNIEDTTITEIGIDQFFDNAVEPIVTTVNRGLEQEQLQEADSTKRVEVPVMDFSPPQPPWTTYTRSPNGKHPEGETELQAQRRLLMRVNREEMSYITEVRGLSRLERGLDWEPFPSRLGQVAVDESIEGLAILQEMLADIKIENVVQSGMLTWKPEGLLMLNRDRESDDDEEVEPASIEDEPAMSALLRIRNLEMQETEPLSLRFGDPARPPLIGPHEPPRECVPGSAEERSAPMASKVPFTNSARPDPDLMFGGMFSASTALSRFMESQGKQRKEPSHIRREAVSAAIETDTTIASKPATKPAPPAYGIDRTGARLHVASPIQTPHLPSELPLRSCIVSSALLSSHRRLFRSVQQLYRSAEFVERDFTSSMRNFSFQGQAPHILASDMDADITISPSTGIMLTTLQKVKQRPLPGQVARTGVKERLQLVSLRYERLVVLVSEGRIDDDGTASTQQDCTMDDRDADALASLHAVGASLDADVQIIYVPGNHEELSRWTTALLYQYGSASTNLLPDETLWELFLRRAGFNAFAAQAVLAEMKAADCANGQYSSSDPALQLMTPGKSSHGLPAFVVMSAEERSRRFESLLGGKRVLQRVTNALDMRWPSAVDGYAGLSKMH